MESAELTTSNGRIRVRGQLARLQAKTSNASVGLVGQLHPGQHQISTSNGSVTVQLPDTRGYTFDASTSNGRIKCAFPLAASVGQPGKTRLRGPTIGPDADQTHLRIVTSNANIDLKPTTHPSK